MLVHGDTTSAITAAMAAYHARIPVVHIEAGLRTGDIYSPWPEEGNRKLITALASLHCAPTEIARDHLLREGVAESNIVVTGNTVIDALVDMLARLDKDNNLKATLATQFAYLLPSRRLLLVTGHRRESFGEGFEQICQALRAIAKHYADLDSVYPVHLNPHVHQLVHARLQGITNIFLISPLDYLAFVYLMQRAEFIMTDSGGIQEEACYLGKPLIILREKTERPEVLQNEHAYLVGTEVEAILRAVEQVRLQAFNSRKRRVSPYGEGDASTRIINALRVRFQQ